MGERVTIDSNIWAYAFMEGDDRRSVVAKSLIESYKRSRNKIIISTQIVNEVCNVMLKKGGVNSSDVNGYIDYFYTKTNVVLVREDSIRLAAQLRFDQSLSFWDSLIVAIALENDCDTLYSEDMQHGLEIEQLRIVNPFHEMA